MSLRKVLDTVQVQDDGERYIMLLCEVTLSNSQEINEGNEDSNKYQSLEI